MSTTGAPLCMENLPPFTGWSRRRTGRRCASFTRAVALPADRFPRCKSVSPARPPPAWRCDQGSMMEGLKRHNKIGTFGNYFETRIPKSSKSRWVTSTIARPIGGTSTASARGCSRKSSPSESEIIPTGIQVPQRASLRLGMDIRLSRQEPDDTR